MSRAIENNTTQQRFEWSEDGMLCVLDYQLQNGVMALTHTGVPEAAAGRGIASDLTQCALDTAARQGLKVRALCSYAAAYIRRHPEYEHLLA